MPPAVETAWIPDSFIFVFYIFGCMIEDRCMYTYYCISTLKEATGRYRADAYVQKGCHVDDKTDKLLSLFFLSQSVYKYKNYIPYTVYTCATENLF